MDVLWTLSAFAYCFLLSLGQDNSLDENRLEQNKTSEVELFPPSPTYAGQTRMPRTLFKKLHSGAAFVAGLKLGTILSKKGFELGHGKIASAHSFQIFGKSVNSAMSLSYGNAGSLLPLVDDVPEGDQSPKRTSSGKENEGAEAFQVAIVESPDLPQSPCAGEKEEAGSEKKGESLILLYQDAAQEEPEAGTTFLQEHNKRVKEFNEGLSRRINSKF